MKEKLQKDVFALGTSRVDHNNLKAVEAIAISVVAILSITVGTIYGSIF